MKFVFLCVITHGYIYNASGWGSAIGVNASGHARRVTSAVLDPSNPQKIIFQYSDSSIRSLDVMTESVSGLYVKTPLKYLPETCTSTMITLFSCLIDVFGGVSRYTPTVMDHFTGVDFKLNPSVSPQSSVICFGGYNDKINFAQCYPKFNSNNSPEDAREGIKSIGETRIGAMVVSVACHPQNYVVCGLENDTLAVLCDTFEQFHGHGCTCEPCQRKKQGQEETKERAVFS